MKLGDPTHGLFHLPDEKERIRMRGGAPLNPIKIFAMLSTMEWIRIFVGIFAWIMDSYDFFSVSMSVKNIRNTFNIHVGYDKYTDSQITYAIMLTLILRSFGALAFGVISDRLGRRWVLAVNLFIVGALSLSTAYCTTLSSFLGVRCVFGIAMGGIWGLANATVMEDLNPAARGLISGIFQQGYAMGYLIAAGVNLGWVNKHTRLDGTRPWEYLFYLGTGLSFAAGICRAILPEGANYQEQRRIRKLKPSSKNPLRAFFKDVGHMLAKYWAECIFSILLMIGFNFFSHSSQDLYPTMIENVKGRSSDDASSLTMISNAGAIAGGILAGYVSQYTGRRIAMICFIILAGAVVPAWILPNSFSGLAAGAFFVQFGVQGAWGVVPIYLSELSPPNFRATFPGLAYQLGNMASSASATIESTGGSNIKTQDPNDPSKMIDDSATVSAILLGCVAAYLLVIIIFGLEPKQGRDFAASDELEPSTAKDEEDIIHVDFARSKSDTQSAVEDSEKVSYNTT
ncbi:Similar to S.cerevisiae protein JEN1 (Monocarboxylate/proton symporter of the plasma membrane) [Malassezia sympodialis ATCC 42132]|uniref:Similar to S.cerevisiae protein JEN1 (Monocarboxylate/proton symporter of the plasma membrane) n=1 Tax=Malassezia sympodialis (strain ATCC 42132) TaxID=1230383 RepID=A0A1M8A2H9_MALS4|nr:Similar to S.cerevisiae protein JEN1 (Monocarboxylate/proton symporter of the plasma membrane) [Malassezia sympodialis ATCC 42132]